MVNVYGVVFVLPLSLFYLVSTYLVRVYLYTRVGNCFEDDEYGCMSKSSHSIYAFSYFVMHVVMMDFFKLW